MEIEFLGQSDEQGTANITNLSPLDLLKDESVGKLKGPALPWPGRVIFTSEESVPVASRKDLAEKIAR